MSLLLHSTHRRAKRKGSQILKQLESILFVRLYFTIVEDGLTTLATGDARDRVKCMIVIICGAADVLL